MNLGSVAIINVSILDSQGQTAFDQLNNMEYLHEMCDSVITKVKLTPLKDAAHQFQPQGISIIYLLAESHLSIHTWPENNSFAMDIHSCNSDLDLCMNDVKEVIYKYLNINEYQVQVIKRQLTS